MAIYDLLPTHFNGVSLTATPFDTSAGGYVLFDPANGPMQAEPFQAIQAAVASKGSQDVRGQPQPAVWHLLVGLSDFTQAGLDSFRTTFSARLGLVYLRANDGNAANFRVACRVIGIDRETAATFIVRLAVPLPLWEENTLQSQTTAGMSGASGTVAVTPKGDRNTAPVITVTPQQRKSERVADWHEAIRCAIVNRAPRALENFPVQLLTLADFSSAGYIKQAANSALLNGAINAAVTSIPWKTPSGSGLDSPSGMAYIYDGVQNAGDYEQIYYTGNSGSSLTGVVRGIGQQSGNPYSWNNNTPIYRSLMHDLEYDFWPWVAGARQERFIGNLSQDVTAQRMYINYNDAAALSVRTINTQTMTAGSPASGGNFQAVSDISAFPSAGVVLIDSELISYKSLDLTTNTFKDIQRGVWGTTAASHTGNAKVWRASVAGLVTVGFCRGNLWNVQPDADLNLARRPAIQLSNSGRDNDSWRYGNEANSVFYDSGNPNRSAMWRPDFTVPVADLNAATPLLLQESGAKLGWEDAEPVSVSGTPLPAGRMALDLPCGLLQSATPITLDVQKRRRIVLRILGVPDTGQELPLLTTPYVDVAEALVTGQTPACNSSLLARKLIVSAVRAATTGHGQYNAATYDLATNGKSVLTKLVLKNDTQFESIFIPLKKAAGTFTWEVIIRDNTGATPDLGLALWKAREWSGDGTLTDFPSSVLTTSFVWYKFSNSLAPQPILPAGTYWIEINIAWTSGTLSMEKGDAIQGVNDRAYNTTPTAAYGPPFVFLFNHYTTNGGPVQVEAVQLDTSSEAYISSLILQLNGGANGQTPYVFASGLQTLYHCNAVISNDQNALTLTIDAWLPTAEPFVIDCDARTVTWKEGNHYRSLPCAVTPSDPTEWLRITSGVTNTFTWTESGMVQTDLKIEWRGKRV